MEKVHGISLQKCKGFAFASSRKFIWDMMAVKVEVKI